MSEPIIFESFETLHAKYGRKLDSVDGHSESNYASIHALLVEELGQVGEAADDGLSEADFIMDRMVGDSLPIGVVVEELIPGTIPAVRRALGRCEADYSVNLDLDEGDVTITKAGELAIFAEDGNAEEILAAIK